MRSFVRIRFPVEGRPLLPTPRFMCFLASILVAGIVLALPVRGQVRSAPVGECTFLGLKSSDRVGPASAQPDGKSDAVFSLTLPISASAPRVTQIEIRGSGPSAAWSTSAKPPAVGFIGVSHAKDPSDILNKRGGALSVNPRQDSQLLLFITDDGKFSDPKRQYQVKVVNSDRTSWTAAVRYDAGAASEEPGGPSGTFPVRMSAVLKGISSYDAVGPTKTIAGDEKGDGLFVLTVEAQDREITGIEIRNVDGVPSVWDTIPGTTTPPIGVALVSAPERLLNNRDASVKIKVKGKTDLNLYVADNGSIAGGNTSYRITVTFADGGITWCPVQKAGATSPEAAGQPPPTAPAKVNFLGTFLGYASTDAVGKYPELKPDGEADAVFRLDIEVTPKSIITGIEITSSDGVSRRWATGGIPGSSSSWGLAVAHQNTPNALVNKADGSVRIPIDDRAQFLLYAADPGDLASAVGQYFVIVHFADGSAFKQFVERPPGATPTVVPGPDEQLRARGTITCRFLGFIKDLVNTSTKPGPDGYLDGTFTMELRVEDKKLVRVDIKAGDGVVRWSSEPKAPVMFLGVAVYPKLQVLVNEKGGPLNLPISGRRTLWLYLADNGLLSDPKSRLTVTATFADRTTLSAEVIK
jgi:hypothetical protein